MHPSTKQNITVQIMYQYKRARENVSINDGVFLENRLSVFVTVSLRGRRAGLFLLPAGLHLSSTQRKRGAAIGTNPNLSWLDLEGFNIPGWAATAPHIMRNRRGENAAVFLLEPHENYGSAYILYQNVLLARSAELVVRKYIKSKMESRPEEKYSIMWQPRTSCLLRKKHEKWSNTLVWFCWTHRQSTPGHLIVTRKTNPFVCSTGVSDHPSIWTIRLCPEIVFWYGSWWQNGFWAEMKQTLNKSPPTRCWKSAQPWGLRLTFLMSPGWRH